MAIYYTQGEERANYLSHGIGILFGLFIGYFLMRAALLSENPWAIGTVPLYLFGMLSSYITSTWYHHCTQSKRKTLLRKFDHGAIYLHIAGTYSPLTLLILRDVGYWGWSLFLFVWLAAIVGFILSFLKLKEHSNLETCCFVAMGGVVLIALQPMINTLSALHKMEVFWLIMAGGVSYITGAIFYSFNKIRYMHSVFHLFCLGGSVCHALAIWKAI